MAFPAVAVARVREATAGDTSAPRGSGVFLGPERVLTCLHVVAHALDRPSDLLVQAADAPSLASRVRAIHALPVARDARGRPAPPDRDDVAVLELERPIAAAVRLSWVLEGLTGGAAVTYAGFRNAESAQAMEAVPSQITRYDGARGVWELRDPPAAGFSGGPVAVMDGGEWRLVGLVVSRLDDEPKRTCCIPAAGVRESLVALGVDVPTAATPYRCMATMPAGFIARRELDELVAVVLDVAGAGGPGSVGVTTAVQGAGGFGKTSLARALCCDPRVRAAFPDGILWTTLGEHLAEDALTGKVLDLIRWWCGDDPPLFTEVGAASAELRRRLSEQRVLVVVDDVWQRHHLDPFLGCGRVVLATTRNRRALPLDCRRVALDTMAPEESAALLGRGLDLSSEVGLSALAARLGHWPLLLGLANARLRDFVRTHGLEVPAALAKLSDKLARRGLTAFDETNAAARERAVRITIELSLDALAPDERRCYERLGIFPEDVELPIAMLARFWGTAAGAADNGIDAEELCERLYGLSLVQHLDLRAGTIRVHDVFRQFLADRGGVGAAAVHASWLAGARPESGRWSDLAAGAGYAWRYLGYHLRGAEQVDELAALLLDFGWLEAKLGAAGVTELIADYELLPTEHPLSRDARLVRDALRLSSHVLARDPGQLPGQLIGRLGGFDRAPTAPLTGLLARCRGPHSYGWLEPIVANLIPPGGPLLRTIFGHTSWVWAVAMSADGRRAVSGSWDHTVRVWDLDHGVEEFTLLGHSAEVNAVAITGDGSRALSASSDRTVKVWDLGDGGALRTLTGHTDEVMAVAVTSDGARAVSGAVDETVRVWDLATGDELRVLTGHAAMVMAVAVSADGEHVVSGSADATVKVWELASGRELGTFSGHESVVMAVAVTAARGRVISASQDKTIKVWELASGRELRTLVGHTDWVNAVAVTADGTRALSASHDETVRVWDLDNGQQLDQFTGHAAGVKAVAVAADGARAVSASQDKSLMVWDSSGGSERRIPIGHGDRVNAVAVTEDGARAITAAEDGRLTVWDVASGRGLYTLVEPGGWGSAMAVSRDGGHLFTTSGQHLVKVWELASGRAVRTCFGHRSVVNAIAVTADGRHAVSGSNDRSLKVWDVASGRELRTLVGHAGSVGLVVVTGDGDRVVSGADDKSVRVWDLPAGRELATIRGPANWSAVLAVAGDGARAISAAARLTLKVWELASGRELVSLSGHGSYISSVVFSGDGSRAVTTSWDKSLKLWELSTGACVATFTGEGALFACAMSADGRVLVAGDSMGRVYFLRVRESGEVG
ncbi:NB-ARC domain-containing protein [Haliangium sp.]|uniref:NB-ARC domain-containing protein n=1 Tax=Haliangium sp. TaxID=2663208 RepID=UPI003D0E92DA